MAPFSNNQGFSVANMALYNNRLNFSVANNALPISQQQTEFNAARKTLLAFLMMLWRPFFSNRQGIGWHTIVMVGPHRALHNR